ncbi:MAG: hypothetical protein LBH85_02390 [Treponema sp.]|jgi:hypothetical protein|nr:hypothetical protein [Treponema sp.]
MAQKPTSATGFWKESVQEKTESIQYSAADVTECPINRLKEGRKAYYSEEKAPRAKTHVVIERNVRKALDVREGKGGVHSFRAHKDKESAGNLADDSMGFDADCGCDSGEFRRILKENNNEPMVPG